MTRLNKQEHRLRMIVSVILGIVIGWSGQSYAHPFTRSGPTGGGGGGGAVFTGGDVPDPTTFADAVVMLTTLAVTGIAIFTGQIQANGNIKMAASRDLLCASANSCEIGASTNYMGRMFLNQLDVSFIRGRVNGAYINADEVSGILMPNTEGTTPTEPQSCDTTDFGTVIVVNDSDDSAVSFPCYCGQQADDSTYDWLKFDGTACPFF